MSGEKQPQKNFLKILVRLSCTFTSGKSATQKIISAADVYTVDTPDNSSDRGSTC